MWSPAFKQRCDRQMQRGHAARRADRADAAFKRGEALFEHRGRRVGNPGVDVAGAFEVEQGRGVLGILEHIGRSLIDRNRARAVHGIWMLPGMQAEGLESGRLGCGHDELGYRMGLAKCVSPSLS